MTLQTGILTRPDGATITYDQFEGNGPGVIFLHGLNSDRGGTKAQALAQLCQNTGHAFLAFDMYGHGESSGDFIDGGISRWAEDTLAVLDDVAEGPQILIGSSMGGWVMLRAALARPDRVVGLVGIAAAPDFTEELMWDSLSDEQQRHLMTQETLEQPSDYDEDPYVISKHLIEDGRACLVLRNPIEITAPVRLIHGQRDADVPWDTSLRLSDALDSDDVETTFVKDGDHRLSRPQDLTRLCHLVENFIAHIENEI